MAILSALFSTRLQDPQGPALPEGSAAAAQEAEAVEEVVGPVPDNALTLVNQLHDFLGVTADSPGWIKDLISLALIGLLSVVLWYMARVVIASGLRALARRTRTKLDDLLLDAQVYRWLSYVLIFQISNQVIAQISWHVQELGLALGNGTEAATIVSGMLAVGALLNGLDHIRRHFKAWRDKPIKGYVQVAKILVYTVGMISAVAVLFGHSPVGFLTGLGALTAVLMLVFKDTILSLVASVQITSTDMLRLGDWIEMPQLKADGDVIDISLYTVRVQNWDKTITAIPTARLISDPFKNWRGMSESGGRRIKRSLYLDVGSVRFLSAEDIERFARFGLLRDYIAEKKAQLQEENGRERPDRDLLVNQRLLTNVGTFRAYVNAYLHAHPKVHKDMTLLVRQLQPSELGLPLELYFFTNITGWGEYEGIQADIFDHLLAVAQEFGLRVFQRPSGSDLNDTVRDLHMAEAGAAKESKKGA